MSRSLSLAAFTSLLSLATAMPAAAHEPGSDVILVYGRQISQIGTATAASEGVVGYADFEDRPLARVGELVEVIPGAVATQHSGEGKGNQYFLRGFNLDHGTDFSASVDGVPVNLRTHGHGQGYLDLNFVIPELVERVDYRKGPYSALDGDFSLAGSARYSTRRTLAQNFADVSVGENGFLRGVLAVDTNLSDQTHLLFGLEGQVDDGPWVLDQDLEKINALLRVRHTVGQLELHATARAYDSEWTSTDQVPLRAVQSGRIDRFGFIDDDLGGETSRYELSGGGTYVHNDLSVTDMQAYLVAYELSLFSNFTYFAEDPINGDEFEQLDQRTYYGAHITHERNVGDRLHLNIGAEARRDDIGDIGLFNTAARQRLNTVRRDEVQETSLGAWIDAEYELTDRLRALAGLRADYFHVDVDALSDPRNSGTADDQQLSPSFGLAWRATDVLEFYANAGRSFHSNDARGATIAFDPVSGDPVETVPILVKGDGAEVGARVDLGEFNASLAVFHLEIDSELVFVGDAGTTEPNDASSRTGIEASAFWRPTDWLVADLAATYTDAQFDGVGPDDSIPNAVDTVIGGGLTAFFGDSTLSARLRHFGDAPLIEDGSVQSEPTTIINASAAHDFGPVTLGVEVYNLFDARDADITYFFESRLPGEATAVEDIHFHPVQPRQVRAKLRYRF